MNLHAIRRAGELLKQIEPAHGANQNISAGGHTKVLTREDAAREAGMSKHQQMQATRIANVPEREFVRGVYRFLRAVVRGPRGVAVFLRVQFETENRGREK